MKTYKLQIASPNGLRYDGLATQLSVRGIMGDLAILAGHIPFVTALAEGECRVYQPDGTVRHATSRGGMLMVSKDMVRVLSSDFEWKDGQESE